MAAMPSRKAKTPSTNPLDAAPAIEPQYCVSRLRFSAVARILLLGSTGFVGRGVAHKILDGGHQLRVLVRDPMKAAAFKVRGAQVVVGDALNPVSVTQAAQGVEHIISLVAVRRNRPQSYLAVNVDGPRILGQAAQAAGVRSVVFVSAIGSKLDPHFKYLTPRAASSRRSPGRSFLATSSSSAVPRWLRTRAFLTGSFRPGTSRRRSSSFPYRYWFQLPWRWRRFRSIRESPQTR